ncbi:uncharacterized protein BDR25DRAFT_386320 [Lindgomyces ingoldianus]|uniref:Uncharacterized protein n=1 Tax=Lindgomyces ingoldianus TaxID=673940 RepID=A0ACB6R4S9_9PLEO|nr:uncharacterized protein BDR25DRAFT_386320 [Lindgomyces ingoldianus]KAF2473532.1 hypothetical protein BDR25DRAFT_386320 [Lindgomyces ingoldianus]
MGEQTGRPDLVVSIDFGMTCTGVAFCNVATGSLGSVRHIQRWPGRMQANENKVPTILVYTQGSSAPSSWGFLAETAQEKCDDRSQIRELFKTMLDEGILEEMRKASNQPAQVPRIHEIEQWYYDYFQFLYRCVETRLKGELASRWEDAKIEFIFSVPTTWRPNPTVERFRNIISRAGFGQAPNHTAVIGLTEAEAAAVHTARSTPAIFKENDILLVCDVGGGTTDLSVFRVKNTSSRGESLSLQQVDTVFGATIGSAHLDTLFAKFVQEKLQLANTISPMGLENLSLTAWEMRSSKEYQNAKCDYGSDESFSDTEVFAVRVPKLDRRYVNEEYGIRNGDMNFGSRDDLRQFFDAQILKLFDMIDKQLVRLQKKMPNEQVAHLVLSGGLGNSAYVRDRLRDRYASRNASHPNARNMKIRVAPNPQLVVCKGNVADRVQKLKSGKSVLGWRCSRFSYGTICKVIYNPQNPFHQGARTNYDPLDGHTYISNYIDWFIKQGEPVSNNQPIVRGFRRKCSPATSTNPNPPRVFPTEIVCSDVDKASLPITMTSLDSDFSSLPLSTFKLKNRHWWNSGPKYHRVDYVVKVNIGPADISFELWHEGVKLSKDNSIKVEWHESAAPDPSLHPVAADLPMNSLSSLHEPLINGRGAGNSGNLGYRSMQRYGARPMPLHNGSSEPLSI